MQPLDTDEFLMGTATTEALVQTSDAQTTLSSDTTREHRHVPALDGIRGMAAILVMVFHLARQEIAGTGPAAIGAVAQFGWAGVDLFFVLSGFLISGILLDSRDRPRFFRTFYRRRALRIFPLYFAFLALYIYVIVPVLPGAESDIVQRQKWLWTYLSNFDVARFGWYAGVGSHANNLWSLAIEEQFYLVFPLAVFFLPRRAIWVAAGSCVVGALVVRLYLAQAGYGTLVSYVLTFTRVDALGLGILVALMARQRQMLRQFVPTARAAIVAAILACGVVTFRNGRFSFDDWSTVLIAQPLLAFGFAGVLLLTVTDGGSERLRRLFESRILRFFGLYSYGLYMWHPLMGRVVRLAGLQQAKVEAALHSSTAAVLLVVTAKFLLAIAAALLSYYVIERPFLRLKDRKPTLAH